MLNEKNKVTPKKRLSPRELELFLILSKGYCFKKAAVIMGVKENTTKTFAYRAYKKLGVVNLQSALYELRNKNFII